MGDVAIIDISANRLNADGTEGEKVLSADQKGEFSTENHSAVIKNNQHFNTLHHLSFYCC